MGDRLKTTRNCLDPWEYIEFRPGGSVSPCCFEHAFTEQMTTDLYQLRNSDSFRTLRENLIKGNLGFQCRICPIRGMVTVEAFRERLESIQAEIGDPLAPAQQLKVVRLDVTERCNLRCVYCAASQPHYRGAVSYPQEGAPGGREMDEVEVYRIIDMIHRYPYPISEIAINGHGETTCYSGWNHICDRLLDDGYRLTITSNFARILDENEIDTLSRFGAIAISIDTCEPELLKKIRRSVNINNILTNLFRIRLKSLSEGRLAPHISFLTGIYDRNISTLTDFARFAVTCQVNAVVFWKLQKLPDIEAVDNVYPIYCMNRDAFIESLSTISETCRILSENGIEVVLPSDFEEDLNRRYSKRVTLTIHHARAVNDWLMVSLSMNAAVSDTNQTVRLYVAFGGEHQLRLLDDQGHIYEWNREISAPIYRVISRVDQYVELKILIKDLDEDDDVYIGCGEDISEVISEAAYVRVPFDGECSGSETHDEPERPVGYPAGKSS